MSNEDSTTMNEDMMNSSTVLQMEQPNFSPQSVIDSASIASRMDKNKESLKVKLMLRRPIDVLVDQGILPPPKSSATFYEQKTKLERAKTGDFLKHKIERRPLRDELIQQHILEDYDPSYYEQERKLKKARLADDLNERLSQRPGPLELIKGNILHTDETLEQAIKEGQITFKKTCEGEVVKNPPKRFVFEEESSSDSAPSPQQQNSITGQPLQQTPPIINGAYQLSTSPFFTTNVIATSKPDGGVLNSNLSYIVSTPNLLSNNTLFITSTSSNNVCLSSAATLANTSAISVCNSINRPLDNNQLVGPNKPIQPSSHKSKKKNKSKNQLKSRIIKFHEYTGPPNVKKEKNSSQAQNETSYELLLKQQQLFLQWQLENQQKYPELSNQVNHEVQVSNKQMFTTDSNSMECENVKQATSTDSNLVVNGNSFKPNTDFTDANSKLSVEPKTCLNASSVTKAYTPIVKKIISKLEDMKVSDLKAELKKRNLPVSGAKQQLIERLKPYSESVVSNNNSAVAGDGGGVFNINDCQNRQQFGNNNNNNDSNNNSTFNSNLAVPNMPNSTTFILNQPLTKNISGGGGAGGKNGVNLSEEFVLVTNNTDNFQTVPFQLKPSNSLTLEAPTLTIPLTNTFIPQYHIVSSTPAEAEKINLNGINIGPINQPNTIQPQLAQNIQLVDNKLNIINSQPANILSTNFAYNQPTANQLDKNNLTILASPPIQLAPIKNNLFSISTQPVSNLTNKLMSIQNPAPVFQQFLLYPTAINPQIANKDITNVIATSKQRSNSFSVSNESLHQLQRNTSLPLIINRMPIQQTPATDSKLKSFQILDNKTLCKSNTTSSVPLKLASNQAFTKNESKVPTTTDFGNKDHRNHATSSEKPQINCANSNNNANVNTCSSMDYCGPNIEENKVDSIPTKTITAESSSKEVQPDSTTSSNTLDLDFMLNFDDLHDGLTESSGLQQQDINGNNIVKNGGENFSTEQHKDQFKDKNSGLIDFSDNWFEMNFGELRTPNGDTMDSGQNLLSGFDKLNNNNNNSHLDSSLLESLFDQSFSQLQAENGTGDKNSDSLYAKHDPFMSNNLFANQSTATYGGNGFISNNGYSNSTINTDQSCNLGATAISNTGFNSFNVDGFDFIDDVDFKDSHLEFSAFMDKVDFAT